MDDENLQTTPEQGAQDMDWRNQLPEDIRGAETFNKYKDVGELANAYLSAQKLIGGKHLPLPETEEEYNKVYKALGRPENEEGYQFGLPEGLTADWITQNIDENWEKAFKQEAFKLGLSAKQAGALRDKFVKDAYQSSLQHSEASQNFVKEKQEALHKEWGNAYETRSKAAELLVQLADKDGEFAGFLKESGLAEHPQMLKFLGNLGMQTIEDDNLAGNKSGNFDRTPEQLDAEIAEINAHPAYVDGSHPQHIYYVNKMSQLFNERYK